MAASLLAGLCGREKLIQYDTTPLSDRRRSRNGRWLLRSRCDLRGLAIEKAIDDGVLRSCLLGLHVQRQA
jgi:hypothetical protein